MTEATIERVANAIADAQIRGWNGHWVLARVAIVAMLAKAPPHVKQWVEDETTTKSIARLKRYREGSRKGWETRRKNKAAAKDPQIDLEEAIAKAERSEAA